MSSSNFPSGDSVDRRTFLKGAAGAATAATATTAASAPATAQDSGSGSESGSGSGDDLAGWFENVSNYDGVVDQTGSSEVTIEVGAQGNDGAFAFGPAAVRVDPGTTVVWEWTGDGGTHNVAAEEGSFESELVGEAGHSFEHAFEEAGVYKYACSPHQTIGMKGAIVVGDEAAASAETAVATSSGGLGLSDYLTVGFGVALVAALFGLPLADARRKDRA
jgi:halocyanin-like protein